MTVGTAMVAVPVAVGPVIARFVPGSTVARVPPLDPKLYVKVVEPAAVFEEAASVSGIDML